jgi:hypothetical protein
MHVLPVKLADVGPVVVAFSLLAWLVPVGVVLQAIVCSGSTLMHGSVTVTDSRCSFNSFRFLLHKRRWCAAGICSIARSVDCGLGFSLNPNPNLRIFVCNLRLAQILHIANAAQCAWASTSAIPDVALPA